MNRWQRAGGQRHAFGLDKRKGASVDTHAWSNEGTSMEIENKQPADAESAHQHERTVIKSSGSMRAHPSNSLAPRQSGLTNCQVRVNRR
ncbi:hypothetical protein [Paraburkholderia bannensis]|uniref:hypothetical protein n=1 Tax=Paraburkholderia bannensis TaxID=765414 RepID=UPI0012EBCC56|nr:hypothetical protein [Paraburkholderia bannensis]